MASHGYPLLLRTRRLIEAFQWLPHQHRVSNPRSSVFNFKKASQSAIYQWVISSWLDFRFITIMILSMLREKKY